MLQPLQAIFRQRDYPNLLVGLEQPDDATIYKINDEQAIVQTVDFFPPVVDDPYYYGAIAAANSLSDVYAMGGEVLFALNILAIPEDMPAEITREIMRGGAEKVAEAGAPIAGGHTVKDKEPKYGLCVTGLIHPDAVMSKGGAKPGDVLVLTKPLGVGVITTAIKRDVAQTAHVDAAIMSMAQLNRAAGKAARSFGARGGTDITGFGLLGHGLEMARGAGVQLVFDYSQLPFLPGAVDYAREWIFPGGASTNAESARGQVSFDAGVSDWQQMLLHDPETSGGLLIPISSDKADALIASLHKSGVGAWRIGHARAGKGVHVMV